MAEARKALPVRFPEDVYERLRRVAYETHASMAAIVVQGTTDRLDALEAELAESGERRHAEALAEAGTNIDPDQAQELADTERRRFDRHDPDPAKDENR